MKTITFILALLAIPSGIAQNSNQMKTEETKIAETVTTLFVATDERNWELLKTVFADSVGLDYSSMNNQPGSIVTADQIIEQWKTVLPGFEYTHHQLGNYLVNVEGNTAHVFCYGTATHYLTNDDGSIWTVVGTYDFNLKKEGTKWVVTSMRFNYKYQSGNTELIQQAIENQKSK